MAKEPITERRAFRIVLGTAIGSLLLAGAGSAYLIGSGTHALTVREAVRRYRAEQATTPAPTAEAGTPSTAPTATPAAKTTSSASAAPRRSVRRTVSATAHPEMASGVYVYDTSGYEETDALSGQRHDYPATTTYTTRRAGCHWVSRWQPVEERWDESEACKTAKGITLKRFSMYHEFFNTGIREDFLCGSDAVVMPWVQRAGDTWTFHCRSSRSTLDMTVRVVGLETMSVGNRGVRAVHVRYEGTVHGDDEGTQIQDRWLDASTGWFLRIVSSADVSIVTPFGRANYRERYRIDLTSMTPEG